MINFDDLDKQVAEQCDAAEVYLRLHNEVALYNYYAEKKKQETIDRHINFLREHGVVLIGNKLNFKKLELYPESYDLHIMQKDLFRVIGYNKIINEIVL